jgi:hypothetical protein
MPKKTARTVSPKSKNIFAGNCKSAKRVAAGYELIMPKAGTQPFRRGLKPWLTKRALGGAQTSGVQLMVTGRGQELEKQIKEVESTIGRQRVLIEELAASGLDTRSAQAALKAMLELLDELRAHRRDRN